MTPTYKKLDEPAITRSLSAGGVGVIPTDTIYGVVGRALSRRVVERIYRLRRRNRTKPFIILISSIRDLRRFKIILERDTRRILKKLWPGKVSIVLPCALNQFRYLHRGTGTLAFRLPNHPALRQLLRRVGPLVAPSANPEGEPPARTITEAKKYFGNRADFYVEGGKLWESPSTLVVIRGGAIEVLRPGAVNIPRRLAPPKSA
jgi:L-threonylcarbamoyladenylate synthase